MLHLDPNRRPTASQVLQHNWIQHRNVLPTHRLPLQEASVIKVVHTWLITLKKLWLKCKYSSRLWTDEQGEWVVRYCRLSGTSELCVCVCVCISIQSRQADAGGRWTYGVGLRSLACWVCGFETRREHRGLSLVVLCAVQVEDSMTGWSLVQRRPANCVCHWVWASATFNPLHLQWVGRRGHKKITKIAIH